MTRHLVISVRLHEGRYHGAGAWPPSPGRLFQALVAGAGLSGPLAEQDIVALEWLETLEAPLVGAPREREGQRLTMWVPGNDLDKVGGDPRRARDIKDHKTAMPRLFDAAIPFVYSWAFEDVDGARQTAGRVSALAERLYQFGRGVDLAWAWAELLDPEALDELVVSYRGNVFRPSPARDAHVLTSPCPCPGSLATLEARYAAYSRRFASEVRGRTPAQVFTRPPAARFVSVAYNCPAVRHLYELRERSSGARFVPWPPTRASKLVTCLRDAAVDRLRHALPTQNAEIERVLVGRKPDASNDGPTSARVKIIPLPSIGHPHADRGIRRVLVEVPPDCALRADDVQWAFSGLNVADREDAEPDVVLTPAQYVAAGPMLAHYGLRDGTVYRAWRTVSPAALPIESGGRATTGTGRLRTNVQVGSAVLQALRHEGVRIKPTGLCVQREPFEGTGERAEAFALGTRFGKERLWHVEISFPEGIAAPLVIGDGRFLGLGLMAPLPGSRIDPSETPLGSPPVGYDVVSIPARLLRPSGTNGDPVA